jgi:hypothetical protein
MLSTVAQDERERLRAEFLRKASEGFDWMFDPKRQSNMRTFAQREERGMRDFARRSFLAPAGRPCDGPVASVGARGGRGPDWSEFPSGRIRRIASGGGGETVVVDHGTGDVVEVGQDRKQETLEVYLKTLTPEQRAAIESVAMDMWKPYIAAVRALVPGADEKIAFDKFHVAKHLGDGVDRVRRGEHRELKAEGDTTLAKTKHLWLQNPKNMKRGRWNRFATLRTSSLKTARAWALKETAMGLWHFISRTWATKGWKAWLAWAQRCRLEPMRKVAAMVREHLWGVLNAVTHGVTNALGEPVVHRHGRDRRAAGGRERRDPRPGRPLRRLGFLRQGRASGLRLQLPRPRAHPRVGRLRPRPAVHGRRVRALGSPPGSTTTAGRRGRPRLDRPAGTVLWQFEGGVRACPLPLPSPPTD